jgi:UDP-N-acetylenolpyruvoylglucosamine reductase
MSGIDGVREQIPLAERTWFKVGGAAQFFAEPASVDEV